MRFSIRSHELFNPALTSNAISSLSLPFSLYAPVVDSQRRCMPGFDVSPNRPRRTFEIVLSVASRRSSPRLLLSLCSVCVRCMPAECF